MSHFTVLVVGSDPERQLRPFQENNCSDCPEEYLQFKDEEDELREEYSNKSTEMLHLPSGEICFTWDKRYKVVDPSDPLSGLGFSTRDKFEYPEGSVVKETPLKDYYKSFEEFAKDWAGLAGPDKKTGRYGYWENPNAKWDWYQIGGRWQGYFRLKENSEGKKGQKGVMESCANEGPEYVDQLLKGNIDAEYMRAEAEAKAREDYRSVAAIFGGVIPRIKSWASVREAHGEDIEAAREEYNNQPDVIKFNESDKGLYAKLEDYPESEDIYAKKARDSALTTFAVLKDGRWYERGEMGWWACVSNENSGWDEEFTKLFDSLSDETLLTIVDCHI